MRRVLRIAGWIGCGLSTLLLAETVVFWVRSTGHEEAWSYFSFEPRPELDTARSKGLGISREWCISTKHGRLWLILRTAAPERKYWSKTVHYRKPISAHKAKELFDSYFQPGERRWGDSTIQAWQFAGAGFCWWRDAVDPRTGQPKHEGTYLAIPFWMLTISLGLWPSIVIVRQLLLKKRHTAGCCPQCGYDLRATSDPAGPRVERCPECGRGCRDR